jgi:2-polyprenyl-3-methyl-5-hydroxy-6-metoxy-1,4-benzoquinol methylase
MPDRLRTSPNFALSQSADGRSFVIGEVEPYPQYWLSDRERLLFALFGAEGGMAVGDAVEAMLCIEPAATREELAETIVDMREAEVLITPEAELSRYGREMARDYLDHRPFPPAIAGRIADLGGIGPETRVLDLAAGPGSLALELAKRTPHVAMMELSRGFVEAAQEEAVRRGVQLETIHESCNRLAQVDGSFNVMTISQAIHWLDDVMLVKGVCRNLAEGGSFFVVHGSLTVLPQHPLSYILGDKTPLGDKKAGTFSDVVRPLYKRISLLFDALDAPDIDRHDPLHARQRGGNITGTRIDLFRQQRPIDENFARAFLSDSHIAALGQDREAFWLDLRQRCNAASADDLFGWQEFALLHYQRGAERLEAADWVPTEVIQIGYPG